ncbi:hypothetical protein BHM03_00025532 [Ensete ventricosum]|nr:hypothetical protein BHM03_00025532 [Ensete ventricosum]
MRQRRKLVGSLPRVRRKVVRSLLGVHRKFAENSSKDCREIAGNQEWKPMTSSEEESGVDVGVFCLAKVPACTAGGGTRA